MNHFLDLADWSSQALREMLQSAVQLKAEWRAGGNAPLLANKVLGMIFQKPSLRTRASFEVAMLHFGGHAMMMGPSEIGLGTRESVPDVARVLSGYVQCIMARVFDHQHVIELAKYASVPVINGLSDAQHPCQAMADVLTIYEHFGRTEGLSVAYVGDGNNVAFSLAQACAHFGMNFSIASPEGYDLSEEVLESAAQIAELEQRHITIGMFRDPAAAVAGADVLYTDTWVSMGQEQEMAVREAAFANYQINDVLLRHAQPNALVLHCLPAHRGQEITDSVADGSQSGIFQQAENRLHAQKAILLKLILG